MGVHGITTLLKERGWLRPASNNECCSARLWKEWNPVEALLGNEDGGPSSSSQRRIPPQSLFLIDGNGLAFYLHQVAYARHIRNVGNTTTTTTTICCPLTNSLNPKQITQVLPCLLPLHLLKEATMEFVSTLRKHNIRMQVFWDGRARRFKALTNQKRKQRRQEEWGTLQQYCFHGSMPKERNTCQWGCHFPFSSMFLKCVRNALHVAFVNMVDCPEEADGELARRASGDPSAYVIGQDSDFFFYKDIQYIPLDSICTSQSSLHAVVGTRVEIAEFLGLEDDQMVEFAILKGNDYVDLSTLKTPIMRDPQSIIAYLQDQDDGYQVDASEQAGRSLEYVRCLYNLENLDSFPLDGTRRQPDTNNNSDTSITSEDDKIMREIQRVISFPGDFPNDQATVFPDDNSVRDAVIRCLQTYIDQSLYTDNEASCLALKQIHLDAYKASTMPSAFPIPLEHRPRWTDIRAAYVIETCISRILQSSRQSFLARGTAPDTLLNHIQFQAVLFSLQGPDFKDDPALADGDSPEVGDTPASPSVERVQLPIDEHESKILETIQNNRVTIIHGETGCGKSSRVPIMLLNSPPPIPSMQVKFFMSQPRRIAAKALVERVRSCEPEHGHKFALRMGHGWREYESNRTQAWFVTTGYLTRLLANHPDRFDDCTHLIIDEVHERSVDTDILCLLCRRLLKNNQKIRLVLMSATLATKLYQDYFQVPNEPIHVGVRKFPIQEFFVEDLAQFGLPPKEAKDALAIQKECESKRCNSAPSQPELSKRFALVSIST